DLAERPELADLQLRVGDPIVDLAVPVVRLLLATDLTLDPPVHQVRQGGLARLDLLGREEALDGQVALLPVESQVLLRERVRAGRRDPGELRRVPPVQPAP